MKTLFPPYPQSLIILVNKVYIQFLKKRPQNLLLHPLPNSAEAAGFCSLGHGEAISVWGQVVLLTTGQVHPWQGTSPQQKHGNRGYYLHSQNRVPTSPQDRGTQILPCWASVLTSRKWKDDSGWSRKTHFLFKSGNYQVTLGCDQRAGYRKLT